MRPTTLDLIEANRALVERHTEGMTEIVNLLVQCERCKQWSDPADMLFIDEANEHVCMGCDDLEQSIILDEIHDELDAMRAMDATLAAVTEDDVDWFGDEEPF